MIGNKAFEDNSEIGRTYVSSGSCVTSIAGPHGDAQLSER